MKLNLGCGHDLRAGWVNVDRDAHDMFGQYDFRRGDARNLAFPDEEFDVVLLNHVLHMCTYDDAEKVLDECVRVLAHPGELVIVEANVLGVVRSFDNVPSRTERKARQMIGRLVCDDVELTEEGKLLRWVVWHGSRRSLWSYASLTDRLIRRGLSVMWKPLHEIAGLERREEESFVIVGVKPS